MMLRRRAQRSAASPADLPLPITKLRSQPAFARIYVPFVDVPTASDRKGLTNDESLPGQGLHRPGDENHNEVWFEGEGALILQGGEK